MPYWCSVEAESFILPEPLPPVNESSVTFDSPHKERHTSPVNDINDPANYISKKLSDDDKLSFLKSKSDLPHNFECPITAGRKFKSSWMQHRPWLKYSITKDRAFCAYCICFGGKKNLSPFVLCGFSNWKKATGKDNYIDQHMLSEAHQTAEEMAHCFLATCQPGKDIVAKLSKQKSEQQIRTKKRIITYRRCHHQIGNARSTLKR